MRASTPRQERPTTEVPIPPTTNRHEATTRPEGHTVPDDVSKRPTMEVPRVSEELPTPLTEVDLVEVPNPTAFDDTTPTGEWNRPITDGSGIVNPPTKKEPVPGEAIVKRPKK